MQPDRTTLVGALKERSGEGRFWAGDLDSESEVEDLGDAEGRPDLVRSTTLESIGQAGNPQDWQEVKKKKRTKMEEIRPVRQRPYGNQWPWSVAVQRQRASWKGSLPKPRQSPHMTIGDILRPAVDSHRESSGGNSGDRRRKLAESEVPRRNSNDFHGPVQVDPAVHGPVHVTPDMHGPVALDKQRPVTLHRTVARGSTGLANRDTTRCIQAIQERLAPKHFQNLSRRQSYAQVVMAGGGAKGTTSGNMGGDGEGEKRRRFQFPRGGRSNASRGRGRRSPSPTPAERGRGGRGPMGGRGRGRGSQDQALDAQAAHAEGQKANVGGRSMEREGQKATDKGDSQQQGGKHRGPEPVGETSKKKKKFQLQCVICLEDHHTSTCPLLLGPKPTATCCGLGAKGTGFFQIPYDKAAPIPKKVTATALIKIVEGEVPGDLVKAELTRLIPVKWDWVVRPNGPKSYLVTFPCQVELQRMVAIKRIPTDKNEGIMAFEEWSQEIKPARKLHKVWVHVYRVPYEIRSFLPLWAVGTIIGAPTYVDMKYTRKTGVVRLQVAVLEVENIPDDADIVVDDCLYEIFFNIENVQRADDGDEFDDADDLDDDRDQPEDGNLGEDQDMEDVHEPTNKQASSGTGNIISETSKSMGFNTAAVMAEAPVSQAVNALEPGAMVGDDAETLLADSLGISTLITEIANNSVLVSSALAW